MTNSITNEIFIGHTQLDVEKRTAILLKSDVFKDYVLQYGKNIIKIELITIVDKKDLLETEIKELLKCRLNNEKILNQCYGCTPVHYVEKIIHQFGNMATVDNVYNKIVSRKIYDYSNNELKNKDKPAIAYMKKSSNSIYINYDFDIRKIKRSNVIVLLESTLEKVLDECLNKSIEYALQGFELANSRSGRYKTSSVMRIVNEFYIDLNKDIVLNELKSKYYRIYKIENLINHKVYVGRTNKIARYRFLNHLHGYSELSHDMQKYGIENFSLKILCYCKNKQEADEKERYWTDFFDQTREIYNIHSGDMSINNDYIIYKLYDNNESVIRITNINATIYDLIRGTKLYDTFKKFGANSIYKQQIGLIPKNTFEIFDKFHNSNLFNNLHKFISQDADLNLLKKECERVYRLRYTRTLKTNIKDKSFIYKVCYNGKVYIGYVLYIIDMLTNDNIKHYFKDELNSQNTYIEILHKNVKNKKEILFEEKIKSLLNKEDLIFDYIDKYKISYIQKIIEQNKCSSVEEVKHFLCKNASF